MDMTQSISMASSLEIRDLPADVLTPMFSLLHGQDIARCISVCRVFSDLIHADLYLQYKIELAQNGMVDGESSTLPVVERLQHLRQYSSNFKKGTFQHEDITAHPDFVLRDRELWWPRNVLSPERLSGCLYEKSYQEDSPLYLSLFVPGSAPPSSRSLHAIRGAVKPDDNVEIWAMDDAQDLFIVAVMDQVPDVHMHFYSLSGLKTDMVTPHPAATLPFIRLHVVDSGKPRMVYNLHIVGDHVVFEMGVEFGEYYTSLFVDAYNWKTGQKISSLNLGMVLVSIIPLDEPYLLLLPCPLSGTTIKPEHRQKLLIYNFSSSSSPSPGSKDEAMSGSHVCMLELPPLARPGEKVAWSRARVDTGDRTDETTGHFRTDPSRSIIVFSVSTEPSEGSDEGGDEDEDDGEYTTYLLIPRTTLSAQISAAESRRRRDPAGFALEGTTGTNPPMLSVPWADWGPRGCLRICPRNPLFHGADADCSLSPFGSRMPVVVFDGPEKESASVYVFDVNPLVARSVLAAQRASDESESDWGLERELAIEREQGMSEVAVGGDGPGLPRAVTVTAVVDRAEDIEEVLPGVVDPECAAIPYVVYRFPLPDSRRANSTVPPEIRQVAMSMAGFTVKFAGNIEYEKSFQTWTV